MSTPVSILTDLSACSEAVVFAMKHPNLETAWAECERGDWMLWFAAKRGLDRKKVVLIACECARLALTYTKNRRVLKCIETTEAWTRGEASIDDVRKARAAADAAAAAYAYAAADARKKVLKQCAEIVRKHLPELP